VPHSLQLLADGFMTLLRVYFKLADYGWESKKCRGLDVQAPSGRFGQRSERAEHEWYSWSRYLAIILLTYLNSVGVIDSEAQYNERFVSPARMFWAFSAVILFSIVLLAIDGYWDRRRRRGLSRIHAGVFWSYFWPFGSDTPL
jgi:hypothetical protein